MRGVRAGIESIVGALLVAGLARRDGMSDNI